MRIAILTHENETSPLRALYTLGLVADAWREAGHEVTVARGTRVHVAADLAVAHVDLTVVPQEYLDWLSNYRAVINGGIADISKRRISDVQLTRSDPWNGSVIVKTDLNCRGAGEKRLIGRTGAHDPWRFVPRAISSRLRSPLTRGSSLWSRYQVLPSIAEVPDAVWNDPGFVVERFLPERNGDVYLLRKCLILGSRVINTVFKSRSAIVDGASAFEPQRADPPEDVLRRAAELGLDYGRIDYGIVDGRIVIYDVNKTPSIRAASPRMLAVARELAPGIER